MATKPQRLEGREEALSPLNAAIHALDLAKVSAITSAKAVCDSASVLLTMIRVGFLPVYAGGLLANVYRIQ